MNEDILKIIETFEKSSISSLELETDDVKIKLEKTRGEDISSSPSLETRVASPEVKLEDRIQDIKDQASEEVGIHTIKSPIVGTFYRASSPDADPFISLGDYVTKGDTVFILEAMKTFNEIKSPVSGRVKEIIAQNGEMVEFDSPLVKIEVEDD